MVTAGDCVDPDLVRNDLVDAALDELVSDGEYTRSQANEMRTFARNNSELLREVAHGGLCSTCSATVLTSSSECPVCGTPRDGSTPDVEQEIEGAPAAVTDSHDAVGVR